jgi:hypothetical protein
VGGENDRERGPLPRRHQGAGVAVGQDPGPLRDQAEPLRRDGRARGGILRGNRPSLGQGGPRRDSFCIHGGGCAAPAGGLIRGERPAGAPAQVGRGRASPGQRIGRLRHILAPVGGQRHAERPRQPKQRRPAHHQAADRIHE